MVRVDVYHHIVTSDGVDRVINALENIGATMATAVDAYRAALNQQTIFNNNIASGVDKMVGSLDGIREDMRVLNENIKNLQTSQGNVTDEDQGFINTMQVSAANAQQKFDALANALKAMDDLNPPVLPEQPPTEGDPNVPPVGQL